MAENQGFYQFVLDLDGKGIDQGLRKYDSLVGKFAKKFINDFDKAGKDSGVAFGDEATKGVGGKLGGISKEAAKEGTKAGDTLGKKFSQAMTKGIKKIGSNVFQGIFQGIGQEMTRAVQGALGAAFGAVTDRGAFMAMDGAKNALQSLGADAGKLEQLAKGATKELKNLASTREILQSSYDIVSSGFSGEDAIGIATVAKKTAVAAPDPTGATADTATVGDAMTSVMNAYKVGADQAEKVASQMIGTVNAGKISMAEYASTIGQVASVAAESSVPLHELNSIIAAATVAGVPVGSAMAGIKASIASIAKPTDDAAKLAKSMGLEFNMSALKSKGLVGVMKEIEAAGLATSDGIFQLFGSTEAWTALSPVFGRLNDDFGSIQDTVLGIDLDTAFDAGSQSAARMQEKLAAMREELALQTQTAIAPIYEAANAALSTLLQSMGEGGVAFEVLNQSAIAFRDHLAANPQIVQALVEAFQTLAQLGVDELTQGLSQMTAALRENPGLIQELVTSLQSGVGMAVEFAKGLGEGVAALGQAVGFVAQLTGGMKGAEEGSEGLARNAGKLAVFATVLAPILSMGVALASMVGTVVKVVGSFGGLTVIVKAIGAAIAAVGAFLGGPIILAIVAIVGAIAGVVAVVKNWGSITEFVGKIFQGIVGVIKNVRERIDEARKSSKLVDGVWRAITTILKVLTGPIGLIITAVKKFVTETKLGQDIWNGLTGIIDGIKGMMGNLITMTGDWLKGLKEGAQNIPVIGGMFGGGGGGNQGGGQGGGGSIGGDLFSGGTDSLAAKIIGHSEGTRTADGGKTSAWKGHTDPGNSAFNKGSFSAQGSPTAGMTPGQADEFWNKKLKSEALPKLEKAAANAGVKLTEKLIMNYLDLYVQSPLAATGNSSGPGFLGQLGQLKGREGDDKAIKSLRVQSYMTNSGSLDAPGFGNSLSALGKDQERRMGALNTAMARHGGGAGGGTGAGGSRAFGGVFGGGANVFDMAQGGGGRGGAGGGSIGSPISGKTIQELLDYQPSQGQSFQAHRNRRSGPQKHAGIDFDARVGAGEGGGVSAMFSGNATSYPVGNSSAGDSMAVEIRNIDSLGQEIVASYTHLGPNVVTGQVAAGQQIGKIGPTDNLSTGAHLDFKVSVNGQKVDPQEFLRAAQAGGGTARTLSGQALKIGSLPGGGASSGGVNNQLTTGDSTTDPAAAAAAAKAAAQAESDAMRKALVAARGKEDADTTARRAAAQEKIRQDRESKELLLQRSIDSTANPIAKSVFTQQLDTSRATGQYDDKITDFSSKREELVKARDRKVADIKGGGEVAVEAQSLPDFSAQINAYDDLIKKQKELKAVALENLGLADTSEAAELSLAQTREAAAQYAKAANDDEILAMQLRQKQLEEAQPFEAKMLDFEIQRKKLLGDTNAEIMKQAQTGDDLAKTLEQLGEAGITSGSQVEVLTAQLEAVRAKVAEIQAQQDGGVDLINVEEIQARLANADNQAKVRQGLEDKFKGGEINMVRAVADRRRGVGNEFGANEADRDAGVMEQAIRHREALLEIEEAIREARRQGVELSSEEVNAMRANAEIMNGLEIERINEQYKTLGDTLKDMGQDAFGGFLKDAIRGADSLGDALKNAVQGFADKLLDLAVNSVMSNLFGGIAGGGGGGGILGMLFGGGGGGGGGLGIGLGSILGMANGGMIPNFAEGNVPNLGGKQAVSGAPFRSGTGPLAKALQREGSQGIIGVFNPGEIVLSAKQSRKYLDLGLHDLVNGGGSVPNYAQGSMPKGSALAQRMGGDTNINISVPVNAEAQAAGVDSQRLTGLIRSVVIQEMQRSQKKSISS